MKKPVLIILLLLGISIQCFGYTHPNLYLDFLFGYGMVSPGYSSLGSDEVDYESFAEPDSMNAKYFGLRMEYLPSKYISFYGGACYLDRPFSVSYAKKAAAYDLQFRSDYSFIQYSVGFTNYIGFFYWGSDISVNQLLDASSEIVSGPDRIDSYFSDYSRSTFGLSLNLGVAKTFRNSDRLLVGVRVNSDLIEVMPEDAVIGETTLAELTWNIAYSVHLARF